MVAAILSVVVLAIVLAAGRPKQNGSGKGQGSGPVVTFAEGARSGNAELDQFVHRFVELCVKGDYDQYRLYWTSYAPPISGNRFRAMWGKAEHIEIKQIAPVPGSRPDRKAYIVRASVKLDAKARIAQRDVDVLVQWEDDRWAIAPAPRSEPADPDAEPMVESAAASQPSDGSGEQAVSIDN